MAGCYYAAASDTTYFVNFSSSTNATIAAADPVLGNAVWPIKCAEMKVYHRLNCRSWRMAPAKCLIQVKIAAQSNGSSG